MQRGGEAVERTKGLQLRYSVSKNILVLGRESFTCQSTICDMVPHFRLRVAIYEVGEELGY